MIFSFFLLKVTISFSISDFKKIVGRNPRINWFEANEKNIIKSNPKDWSKFAITPKTPKNLDDALKLGLESNPEYVILKIQQLLHLHPLRGLSLILDYLYRYCLIQIASTF